jgi:hypothetical protein
MRRYIEVQNARSCPSPLCVQVGDVLVVYTAGARVRSGDQSIQLLGPFITAMVGQNGEIIEPAGNPGLVILRGLQPGLARVELILGEAPLTATSHQLWIKVES